jgi:putative transposase
VSEWFSAAELAQRNLPNVPSTKVSVIAMAEREGWRQPEREGTHWRRRSGRGGGFEYHLAVLPRAAQTKLAIAVAAAADPRGETCRAEAWAWFDTLPEKKKQVARERMEALETVETLVRAGLETVVAMMEVSRSSGAAVSTLYRWREATYGLDRGDWLPALAPRHAGRQSETECSPEAWEALKADYLRLEKPNMTDCYRRLQQIAAVQAWTIPSKGTLERRIAAIPVEVRTLKREGTEALKRMFPAQQRTRGHFHALEAVNADGHKWDVFVRWPDGTIGRPMMCAFQDLYSGLILSWRVDRTANKEAVRLAFGDLVEAYGIPSLCYLDNGRDFASKWITGGTPNRFRFKVRDEEPSGVMTMLGVEVHWTTPYSGQSKPIERAFRDMAGGIAKHPRFAGAYCGNKPDAKPENYGNAAVPLDVFIKTLGEEIAEHNARLGRKNAVCGGRLSFAQAFAASYASAPIRKATAEQRRLWLLAAEQIRVDRRDGSITLEGNRFWGDFLAPFRGQFVTVRFDPQALQEPLHVYRADGGYLGSAQCTEAAGFNDVDAAREHSRKRKAFQRATRELADAEVSMSIKQLAELLPEPPAPAALPDTKVVRPFIPQLRTTTALKPVPDEDDDLNWLKESNALARQQRAGLHLIQGGDGDD